MLTIKTKIVIALCTTILLTCISPIWAVTYNPGVSVGQWVKYGNFTTQGTGIPKFEFSNQTISMKMEVTAVSGKVVTLQVTGQYNNGSTPPSMVMTVNVATGEINGSETSVPFFFVTATGLQQGDILYNATDHGITTARINSTVTRNYMSVNRIVSVLNITQTAGGSSIKLFMTWDQSSGMLMEMKIALTSITQNAEIAFTAVDTNIFATGITGLVMDNLIWIIVAIIAVIIIIVAALALRMRRKPPAPAAPPETASTPPATPEAAGTSET